MRSTTSLWKRELPLAALGYAPSAVKVTRTWAIVTRLAAGTGAVMSDIAEASGAS